MKNLLKKVKHSLFVLKVFLSAFKCIILNYLFGSHRLKKKKSSPGLTIYIKFYVESSKKADYYDDLIMQEAQRLADQYDQTFQTFEVNKQYLESLNTFFLSFYFEIKPNRSNLKFGRQLADYCFLQISNRSDISNI